MQFISHTKIDAKVIVLTNYAEPQYRQIFLRQGAYEVLDKSHEFDRVEGMLLSLIEAR